MLLTVSRGQLSVPCSCGLTYAASCISTQLAVHHCFVSSTKDIRKSFQRSQSALQRLCRQLSTVPLECSKLSVRNRSGLKGTWLMRITSKLACGFKRHSSDRDSLERPLWPTCWLTRHKECLDHRLCQNFIAHCEAASKAR